MTGIQQQTPERKPEEPRGRGQPPTQPPHSQVPTTIQPVTPPHVAQQAPSQPSLPPGLTQPPPASLAAKHSYLQQQFNQLNIKDDSEGT